MDTAAMIVSLIPEGANIIHGENKNKMKYNKKNQPIVERISCHMREKVIIEEDTKEIKSTPLVNICW